MRNFLWRLHKVSAARPLTPSLPTPLPPTESLAFWLPGEESQKLQGQAPSPQ